MLRRCSIWPMWRRCISICCRRHHAIVRSFTPEGVAQAIEKFKVTDTLVVPTMVQMLVDNPGIDKYDLSSLATSVRRLANERSGDGTGHEETAERPLHAGLRHDRAVAMRHCAAVAGPSGRRPREGPAPLGGPADIHGRRPYRRCPRPSAAAWRRGRDRGARRDGDDGLLGAAGRN